MGITDLNPADNFFRYQNEDYFPADKLERSKYVPLNHCNAKILQFKYGTNSLKSIIQEYYKTEDISFETIDTAELRFFCESNLILAKSICDLTFSSICKIYGHYNIDSISKLKKNLIIFTDSPNYSFFKSIVENSKKPFTWENLIIPSENGRSLRDVIVHKSAIDVSSSYIMSLEKDQISVDFTKMFIEAQNRRMLCSMEISKFVIMLDEGIFDFLNQVKLEIDEKLK